MSDSTFNEYLKKFGLTNQESVIYESLLCSGAMTGYEVAKNTGISRSNVYSSLAGLVEKGAAYLIEGEPTRYTPVAMDVFCKNTISELSDKAKYLINHAPKPIELSDGYITIVGYKNIHNMIVEMLDKCEYRVYILAEATLIHEFDDQIKSLLTSNKKVVIMTDEYDLEGCIFYKTEPDKNQLRIITDSSYVLTGDYFGKDSDTCLYSGQHNLVSVLKEALEYRIKLINLSREGKNNESSNFRIR